MILNIGAAVNFQQHTIPDPGRSLKPVNPRIFIGNCAKASRLNAGLHILNNVVSTLLVADFSAAKLYSTCSSRVTNRPCLMRPADCARASVTCYLSIHWGFACLDHGRYELPRSVSLSCTTRSIPCGTPYIPPLLPRTYTNSIVQWRASNSHQSRCFCTRRLSRTQSSAPISPVESRRLMHFAIAVLVGYEHPVSCTIYLVAQAREDRL